MQNNHPVQLVVIEAIESGMSSTGETAKEVLATSLESAPWSSATFPTLYVDPGTQMTEDYYGASGGYPVVPLIDLTTMKVLVKDCRMNYLFNYEKCVTDHL